MAAPDARQRPGGRRERDLMRQERLGWLEERVDGLESKIGQDPDRLVARAVRDANVDRDLQEHDAHLAQINGSQQAMAASLARLEDHVTKLAGIYERQAAVTEALTGQALEHSRQTFSRRTLWLMGAGALSGYGGLIATLVALH